MVRILILTVVMALAASPASAQEAAVTVAAPAFAKTIGDAEIERWAKGFRGISNAQKRELATRLLIEAAWYEGEGAERGIAVTREEIEARVKERAAEEYPTEAAFRRAIERRGLTLNDVRAQVRADALRTAIHNQITEPAAKSVTPEQIEAYVQANPRMEPEERRVRIVRTKHRRHAERALAALRRGLTWRSALNRYGSAAGSGQRTWLATADPTTLDKAIFSAPLSRLTRYGATVFKVIRITPSHPTPIEVQRAQAWEVLATQAQKLALQQHDRSFREKWRHYTTCAPNTEAPEHCGNSPMGG